LQPRRAESLLGHRPFHQRETVSQTPGFPLRAGESADGGAEVSAGVVASAGGGAEIAAVVVAGDEAIGDAEVASAVVAGGGGGEAGGGEAGGDMEVATVVVAGIGGGEAGGGAEVAAAIFTGLGEAGCGAEVAAVVFAGFAFVRAAGGFMAPGANGANSAMTGSGVITVVGVMPESPDCMELDSFTAMRTGTLCG
jgi:hypothetical protein